MGDWRSAFSAVFIGLRPSQQMRPKCFSSLMWPPCGCGPNTTSEPIQKDREAPEPAVNVNADGVRISFRKPSKGL